jgi:hypothetical protein
VLGRDEDVVDRDGDVSSVLLSVLNDNLRLAVGSEPSNFSTVSLLSHNFSNLVSEVVRVGEEGLGVPLIGGVAEHESLISSTKIFDGLLLVDRVGDLASLSLNLYKDIAVIAVQSNISTGVADLLADTAGNGFVVNFLFAGNFSKKSNL